MSASKCIYNAQGILECSSNPYVVNNQGSLTKEPPTDRTWKVLDPNPVCNSDMPFCDPNIGKTPDCKLYYCKNIDEVRRSLKQ